MRLLPEDWMERFFQNGSLRFRIVNLSMPLKVIQKIDDDILKKELGTNSDVKLKNIVRTIQKEQNAIIRNTKRSNPCNQGAAGSGKTSVALHRIAYLLYHERDTLKSSNILILSPNSVFADYISHILPEL